VPYRPVVDVHLILERADGQVLLAERSGTGYGDGLLNVPGGKLEDGETVLAAAIRETREELGVTVNPADTRFVTVVHHRNPGGVEARVGFFFATRCWSGEPVNAEPDKCAGLVWADPENPPANTIGYTAAGLRAHGAGAPFALDGWSDLARVASLT
jgi:8-oxo-dGTP pyrophosphatase MutT (NUDIX family)